MFFQSGLPSDAGGRASEMSRVAPDTVRFSIAGGVQTTVRKWPSDRMGRLVTVPIQAFYEQSSNDHQTFRPLQPRHHQTVCMDLT